MSKENPASEGTLNLVHKLLAEWALRLLRGELTATTVDKDGEERQTVVLPTAAEISVIRAFLKDNEITAPTGEGTALHELKRKLEAKRGVLKPFDPERDLPATFQ